MRNLCQTWLAGELVNLTGGQFSLYEENSGTRVSFSPELEMELPETPSSEKRFRTIPSKYYVVEKKEYLRIKETGRDMDDIAVISRRAPGNGGEVIYLFWGENPDFRVIFYSEKYIA